MVGCHLIFEKYSLGILFRKHLGCTTSVQLLPHVGSPLPDPGHEGGDPVPHPVRGLAPALVQLVDGLLVLSAVVTLPEHRTLQWGNVNSQHISSWLYCHLLDSCSLFCCQSTPRDRLESVHSKGVIGLEIQTRVPGTHVLHGPLLCYLRAEHAGVLQPGPAVELQTNLRED